MVVHRSCLSSMFSLNVSLLFFWIRGKFIYFYRLLSTVCTHFSLAYFLRKLWTYHFLFSA
jgi:hypothetical protein